MWQRGPTMLMSSLDPPCQQAVQPHTVQLCGTALLSCFVGWHCSLAGWEGTTLIQHGTQFLSGGVGLYCFVVLQVSPAQLPHWTTVLTGSMGQHCSLAVSDYTALSVWDTALLEYSVQCPSPVWNGTTHWQCGSA